MSKIFITGGISSGKSSFAEKTALSLHKSLVAADTSLYSMGKNDGMLHFIATAKTLITDNYQINGTGGRSYEDEEMLLKISRHKDKRDADFIVHENFKDLNEEIALILKSPALSSAVENGIILIDSMTLWLSSIFIDISCYDYALKSIKKFSKYLSKIKCSVITVADSLGFNMVPTDAYVRKFIELNGLMEQELSAFSDKAYCVIAGQTISLK